LIPIHDILDLTFTVKLYKPPGKVITDWCCPSLLLKNCPA